MEKVELYETVMRAIILIEDGSPNQAKLLLEELVNKIEYK